MASHAEHHGSSAAHETLELSGRASSVALIFLVVGVVGVLGSLGMSIAGGGGVKRFYFAYLTTFMYVLSIGLGALLFVLLQHLVRAGWSVSVRRIAESLAATLPVIGLLSIPLLVSVLANKGDLYPWAQPLDNTGPGSSHLTEMANEGVADPTAHGADHAPAADHAPHGSTNAEKPAGSHSGVDGHAVAGAKTPVSDHITPLTVGKVVWLNPWFFIGRVVFYFVFWSAVALYFWKKSRLQDENGDPAISHRLGVISAPLILVSMVTLTFGALDLIMSLDPDWYSTMFGVYYFAGCAGAAFASLIIISSLLQRFGYLRESISVEHYHDLGKFLFGFTFFWGYIAFSQYMLIWYANLPETTYWFANRGATTNPDNLTWAWGWSIVTLLLLFGRLFIPFGGLLSRHVKRNKSAIVFWAWWIMIFHWIDIFWLVMPEYVRSVTFGLPEVLSMVGLVAIFVGAFIWRLSTAPLRPVRDPRLPESLAFHNI